MKIIQKIKVFFIKLRAKKNPEFIDTTSLLNIIEEVCPNEFQGLIMLLPYTRNKSEFLKNFLRGHFITMNTFYGIGYQFRSTIDKILKDQTKTDLEKFEEIKKIKVWG